MKKSMLCSGWGRGALPRLPVEGKGKRIGEEGGVDQSQMFSVGSGGPISESQGGWRMALSRKEKF